MTPDNPQDPQKGKVDEAQVAEDAKAAKQVVEDPGAQPEPKAKRKPKKTAEETAAADKPARRPRANQADPTDEEARPAAKEPETERAAEEPRGRRAPARTRDQRRPVERGVTVSAHAKYVRTSARKARLVCDHIRGKDVAQARAILAFTPRAAAKDWAKLLESAVANAEHNHELVGEDLRIAAVYADEGPTLKRYRPRAMGRATRIRKRTSHLTITLAPAAVAANGRKDR